MAQLFPQAQRSFPAAFHAPLAKNQGNCEEAFRDAMQHAGGSISTEINASSDLLPVESTLLPVLPFTLEMVRNPYRIG